MALYLADTSAWSRSAATPAIAERWRRLIVQDELAVSPPVTLELLVSARSPADYVAIREDLFGFPNLAFDDEAVSVAERTQTALAEKSQHRVPPMDLFVAAVAELHGATLLHYDRHFDTIARATGQPAEWLARRGSLD